MNGEIILRDPQVLNDLKSAVLNFHQHISSALIIGTRGAKEMRSWIKERHAHWQNEVERADQELCEARSSLSTCQAEGNYDEDGNETQPDCDAEIDALYAAEQRLAGALECLERAEGWSREINLAADRYAAIEHHFRSLTLMQVDTSAKFLGLKAAQYQQITDVAVIHCVTNDTLPATGKNDTIKTGAEAQKHGLTQASDANLPWISPVESVRMEIRASVYKRIEPIGGLHLNRAYRLYNGRIVVFKPKSGESADEVRKGVRPGSQYCREIAASILDEVLGLGIVPPTTLLERGGPGSAQLHNDKDYVDAVEFEDLDGALERLSFRQKHDWQLFDELSAHLDRHSSNYMLSEAGSWISISLIDNGLAFPTVDRPKSYPGLLDGEPIDPINQQRLLTLVGNKKHISERLKPFLEEHAIELVFKRAHALIERKTYGKSDI